MPNNTDQILLWLRGFKTIWLPKNISNDVHLRESIETKLLELEQLIKEIDENEEEYHRAQLLNDHSSSSSDNEQMNFASTSRHESLPESTLLTPLHNHHQGNNHNDEEQSRQLLLEPSDESDNEHEQSSWNESTSMFRPSIRLKRISPADAELYMPLAWRNGNSTKSSSVNHVSNAQDKQLKSLSNSDDDDVASDSNPSQALLRPKTNHLSSSHTGQTSSDDEKQSKRKLRTSHSDELSISSKTRKHNGLVTSSTSDEEDFTVKYRTRRSLSNQTEKQSIELRKRTTNSYRKNEVIISYDPSAILNEPSLDDSLSVADDLSSLDEYQISKDVIVDNESGPVLVSVDAAPDKPMETDDNNVADDTSNDGIDPSPLPAEDPMADRSPITVPTYGHLLDRSKLSSLSESDHENFNQSIKRKLSLNDKNPSENSKRSVPSSPNSDASQVKKKSRNIKRQRADLSLSMSSEDSDNTSTSSTAQDKSSTSQKQSSSRIQIQRSSSSEQSDNTHEHSATHSRQRRKKTVVTKDRSPISQEVKCKTKKKKDSLSSTSTDDSDENRSSGENQSETKSKSSDDENDEEMSPSKRKLGRKNIRKILHDKELDVQTKDAIEAEQERRRRIAEKQKEYNETLLEQSLAISNDEDNPINQSTHRLILELDKTTNEPLIEVSPKLVEQLKPHQCDGIRFLWNNVFESIDVIQKKKHNGNGCILAHCMGLGKTLQIISFLHTVFNYDYITKVKTCLVLCPINAALNWSTEFEHWLKNIDPPIDHYQLTTVKPNLRISHVNYWYKNGGVMIMGYEMYRRLANGFGIKNKKLKTEVYECLVDPGPDIVVADEGHILKNAQTALAKSLSKIKTSRRIVLTGTPLQNNLIEYYCMVSFIKPNLLGSQQEYINRFVNPIQNGQHRDSNEHDVRLMKRRACVLHDMLTGFVDRKDYSLLKEYLPPKFEYIINIRLSDLQSQLYETYLKKQVNQAQRSSVSKTDFKSAQLFADYQFLQKIWTHPFLLYPHFIDRWKKRSNTDGDSFVDDRELETMLIDDDEIIDGKTKTHKKTKTINPQAENSYSGFLIDNIDKDIEENKPTTSKSKEPTSSNPVIIELDLDGEDDLIVEENRSNSKSEESGSDFEIVNTYPTRSQTTNNAGQKHPLSKISGTNVFDTENERIPAEDFIANPKEMSYEPWLNEMRQQFWFSFLDSIPEEDRFDPELSGKFLLLKFILDKCFEIGDKVLLFSRSIYTLNYIEKFLNHIQIDNEKEYQKQCDSRRQLRELLSSHESHDNVTNGHIPEPIAWIRDRDYFRMDGHTEVTTRKRYAKAFNEIANSRARLFLISTLAGGIGINLTGSNRVIVFDASWNPSHDTQAIFRSYRFGQKKPVYIYRFLAHGTMEEKIYQRQVVKQSISQRVVDDHQLDRHFTQSDIKELYKFNAEKLPERRSASTLLTELSTESIYPIPKDHLLLDLLYEHNRWIHSYHSHDLLLENKIDEGLTAEERHIALEEYENLKRQPDQLAVQRFQQQQQLNALIAKQRLQASAEAARVQQQNLNRYLSEVQRTSQLPNGTHSDYNQMLQYVLNETARSGPVINDRTNSTAKSTHKHKKKSTAGQVPIRPRPTTTNIDPNVVIIVDSDGEPDNNSNETTSK